MVGPGVYIRFNNVDQSLSDIQKTITAYVYLDASGNTYDSSKDPYWRDSVFYETSSPSGNTLLKTDTLPYEGTTNKKNGGAGWRSFTFGNDSLFPTLYLGQKAEYVTDIGSFVYSWAYKVYGIGSAYPPYMIVRVDEGTPVATVVSPAGFIELGDAHTFTWSIKYPNWPSEDPLQTSATLQWQDGDGAIKSVAISGGAKSYTMPRNTLPLSNTLHWRVVVKTADGEFTSEWKSIRTADLGATVTALSPSGAIVDGSKPIRLTWRYDIATGTEQTKYEVQYSNVW